MEAGMRISPIIVASLAIIWPALTADSVAQQSTAAGSPNPASTEASPNDIIERIKKGKGGAMPAFGSVFSDGQIVAIVAYIRGLDD
jgi:hypothetical protein